MIVLLDAGPLGMITNPRGSFESDECNSWLRRLLARSVQVLVPEIADYEVRRELLRAGKASGIGRLDSLKRTIGYLPLNTETMLKAAEFWAEARRQGQPAAHDHALDADVILAAQAHYVASRGGDVIIATTNVGHLARFARAGLWRDID